MWNLDLSYLNCFLTLYRFNSLLNIKIFGAALICKSLWRGIFGFNPWSDIIRQKYKKGRGIEFWFRSDSIGIQQGSAIWHSFKKVQRYFLSNLKWKIFTGRKILIGLDPIAGFQGTLQGPPSLLFFLHRSGYFTWNRIIKDWCGPSPMLRDVDDIRISVFQWTCSLFGPIYLTLFSRVALSAPPMTITWYGPFPPLTHMQT